MKILLLHDVQADKQNGVSVSLGILSRELEKLGYDIKIVTLSDAGKSRKEGNNYYLSSIPALIYPGIRMRLRRHNRFADEIIEWNPDIIHTNCEFSTFRIAKYIRSRCEKTPVWIHTFHTDYQHYIGFLKNNATVRDKWVPWYLNRCFVMSDALIVPTNKIYTYVSNESFAKHINKNIIPTGIDFSELKAQREQSRAETKRELGIPEDAKVLIFLGRISAEKNLDELIECFTEYRKKYDNVYLLTVGDGPYKETLIKKVNKFGIQDRVIVHPGVQHTDIRRFYDVADVFASASESETQGLTFYEALFCNVPVLAKDKECLEGAINEGENGAFFYNAESFIESLNKLIDLKDSADGSETKLPECFESEYFARSVASLYEDTLKKQQESPVIEKSSFDKILISGVKLRFKIKKNNEKIISKVTDKTDEFKAKITDESNKLKDKITDGTAKIKEKISGETSKIKEKISDEFDKLKK